MDLLKSGQVTVLKDLINYESNKIVHLDVITTNGMKLMMKAFDEGCILPPHTAPGDAIVIALEGSAVITYEGQDYSINAGECFKFDKNGLHSVLAKTQYKMAVLLLKE